METAVSRLTSKGQATIPKKVRKHLKLEAGDRIAFKITDANIEIARAEPLDVEFMRAQEGNLADEWLAAEDQAAYGEL